MFGLLLKETLLKPFFFTLLEHRFLLSLVRLILNLFLILKNLNAVLDIIFVWASFATGKNDAKELDRMGMFNFSAAAVIIHIMVKPIQENLSKKSEIQARQLKRLVGLLDKGSLNVPSYAIVVCRISFTLLI